jgi:hypothetical protein
MKVQHCRREDLAALERQVDQLIADSQRPRRRRAPSPVNLLEEMESVIGPTPREGATGVSTQEATRLAAEEWDRDPAVRETASTRELFILARAAELDGSHRSFIPVGTRQEQI